jgi:hypothetical protein
VVNSPPCCKECFQKLLSKPFLDVCWWHIAAHIGKGIALTPPQRSQTRNAATLFPIGHTVDQRSFGFVGVKPPNHNCWRCLACRYFRPYFWLIFPVHSWDFFPNPFTRANVSSSTCATITRVFDII